MNIAVDAFPLSTTLSSGIPNYLNNILNNLLSMDKQNRYFLFCKNHFQFVERINLRLRFGSQTGKRSLSYINTLWLFSIGVRMMKRDKIDIFWGTRQMLPPFLPAHTRKVLTVYDMVWHYFPETMGNYNRLVSNLLAMRSIKSADHIITISKATAGALTEIAGVPPKKISVVYPAADSYNPLDKSAAADYIAGKYGTYPKYILTVSTVEPRKNLTTLLRAFAALKNEDIQLLIAGASGWKNSAVYAEYEKLGFLETQVKFLGYVPDEDMNNLYSGASLFVFPSKYEGFGIPPLEAMASGTPVIVSNSSSLLEVAGGAGILIEPMDETGWRETILKVLSDFSLQKEMIKKGLEQANSFSWKEAGLRTLKIFDNFV